MDDFPDLVEEVANLVKEPFLDWPTVARMDTLQVRERPCSPEEGFVCMVTTVVVPISLEEISSFARAEDMMLIQQANPEIVGGEVLKVFSPGDVLVRVHVKRTPKTAMVGLMGGGSAKADKDCGPCAATVRSYRRAEYPKAGMIFRVSGPVVFSADVCGYPGALAHRQSSGRPCMAGIWEALGTGETVSHIFSFMPLSRKWMVPMLAKASGPNIAATSAVGLYNDLKSESDLPSPSFVVLRIKKCSRGPPLLTLSPKEAAHLGAGSLMTFNDELWTPSVPETRLFELSTLIKTLIRRFLPSSHPEDDVFETMDGRRLIFFECVVRRSTWEAVEAQIMQFFQKQAPAYRHWHGGRSAPSLQVGRLPIFVENEVVPPCHVDSHIEKIKAFKASEQESAWPCKNTFIHFEEESEEARLMEV